MLCVLYTIQHQMSNFHVYLVVWLPMMIAILMAGVPQQKLYNLAICGSWFRRYDAISWFYFIPGRLAALEVDPCCIYYSGTSAHSFHMVIIADSLFLVTFDTCTLHSITWVKHWTAHSRVPWRSNHVQIYSANTLLTWSSTRHKCQTGLEIVNLLSHSLLSFCLGICWLQVLY